MSSINDIPAGLRVPAQVPLDAKLTVASQGTLSYLGPNNNLAYTYYKGMTVYCAQEQTRWEWREPASPSEIGLLGTNFVYPPNLIVFGINYSNKAYNFFPVNLTSNGLSALEVLSNLEISFDWKRGTQAEISHTPADLPQGVTNNVYLRNGFVGFWKPIEVAGEVVHPNYSDTPTVIPAKLIEAEVTNLGVKIKNFQNIAQYSPTIVISKYTPTRIKAPRIPSPGFNDTSWRKGSYKFSQDADTVRLTRVPIQASYQLLDFGQEHYFKTSKSFQTAATVYNSPDVSYLRTRAALKRYAQNTPIKNYSKAFVYLQFHIEITVGSNTYLSAPLGRLKMIMEFKPEVGETYPVEPGDIVPMNFSHSGEIFRTTKIYFKHT